MKGLVIRNTGYSYTVKADDGGGTYECKVKGNFRIKGIRTTNPVAIGDRVTFTPLLDEAPAGSSADMAESERRTAGLIRGIRSRFSSVFRE